ncbi:hypothetical protein KDL01_04355 [Actinospica durhamensis]|uniref:Uncharacterized protein n=1 Tax=Actinospica durhamensis TaxID=1508375 RepID=A0A941EH30_9ACTN|nr:hypothetical protein [Actinospica durhamensis]MBR7832475.1 hypothetical protein [Actinospica durhamensis]
MPWIVAGLALQFVGAVVMTVGFRATWMQYRGDKRLVKPFILAIETTPKRLGRFVETELRMIKNFRRREALESLGRRGASSASATATDEGELVAELQRRLTDLEWQVAELDEENAKEHEAMNGLIYISVQSLAIGGLATQAAGLFLVTVGAFVAAVPSLEAGW